MATIVHETSCVTYLVENISEHVNPVTRSIRMATRNPLAKYRQSPHAKFPDAFTLVNYFLQTHVGTEVAAESFMSKFR